MSDFWQSGSITTIHRLPGSVPEDLSATVGRYCLDRPVALLIPALASEMDRPAFPRMMEELKTVRYPAEIVLALGGGVPSDLSRAKDYMGRLPVKGTVVWPESDNLAKVLEDSRQAVDPGPPGKGRDVWITLGYLLGRSTFHAFALHDADIVTYTSEIPLRLLAPLVHPELDYAFCKGYYARITGKTLAGRVTRLLVSPLLRVLLEISDTATLNTMADMRYALAGEFALTTRLAAAIPIPRDWGLEVGIISAVSKTVPSSAICQSDLCDNYEHKHQDLSPDDRTRGLNRMAVEVAANLFRELGAADAPDDLSEKFRKRALGMIPAYMADALVNGLHYDLEREKATVETFTQALQAAIELINSKGIVHPLPPWNETERVAPGLQKRIVEAVEKDNE